MRDLFRIADFRLFHKQTDGIATKAAGVIPARLVLDLIGERESSLFIHPRRVAQLHCGCLQGSHVERPIATPQETRGPAKPPDSWTMCFYFLPLFKFMSLAKINSAKGLTFSRKSLSCVVPR